MFRRNLIARREADATAAQRAADEHRAAADLLRTTGTGRLVDNLIGNREAAASRARATADEHRAAAARLRQTSHESDQDTAVWDGRGVLNTPAGPATGDDDW